jgi:hypothetical protein
MVFDAHDRAFALFKGIGQADGGFMRRLPSEFAGLADVPHEDIAGTVLFVSHFGFSSIISIGPSAVVRHPKTLIYRLFPVTTS